MTMNKTADDWTDAVIVFLSKNLPPDRDGWDHMYMSAYQMGCDALVALGQAEETDRGAVRRKNPMLADALPRWDDICSAVLGLAVQMDGLAYRTFAGLPLPGMAVVSSSRPTPPPNIKAGSGLGLAYAKEEILSVLRPLGLVAENHWTDDAELVLWRKQPRAWGLNVAADRRFAEAVEVACTIMPADIRQEVDGLKIINDAEVDELISRLISQVEDMHARFGLPLSPALTPEEARKSLESGRPDHLNSLFFRRWRISDGWLTASGAKRALEIFHDPLAMMMRRAVVSRLYPDVPFFSGR